MTAKEFYEANATNICNVPRPSHPEDPSGWDGVRRASEAQFIAKAVPVMPLWDVCDFAEKYHSAGVRELTEALGKYGTHKPECNIPRKARRRFGGDTWEWEACNCGFAEALARIKGVS
jgi:hypothetical protein